MSPRLSPRYEKHCICTPPDVSKGNTRESEYKFDYPSTPKNWKDMDLRKTTENHQHIPSFRKGNVGVTQGSSNQVSNESQRYTRTHSRFHSTEVKKEDMHNRSNSLQQSASIKMSHQNPFDPTSVRYTEGSSPGMPDFVLREDVKQEHNRTMPVSNPTCIATIVKRCDHDDHYSAVVSSGDDHRRPNPELISVNSLEGTGYDYELYEENTKRPGHALKSERVKNLHHAFDQPSADTTTDPKTKGYAEERSVHSFSSEKLPFIVAGTLSLLLLVLAHYVVSSNLSMKSPGSFEEIMNSIQTVKHMGTPTH